MKFFSPDVIFASADFAMKFLCPDLVSASAALASWFGDQGGC
ncbi:hypothetical protein WME90_37180 [Sorangium sp. So ce375]|jgi:hypothetical protein